MKIYFEGSIIFNAVQLDRKNTEDEEAMSKEVVRVLVGSQDPGAESAAEYMNSRGARAVCIPCDPLSIQQEAMRGSYDAAVIRSSTAFCGELCRVLKNEGIGAVMAVHDGAVTEMMENADAQLPDINDRELLWRKLQELVNMQLTINKDTDVHSVVTMMLSRLSVSPKYTGYNYIREAVKLAADGEYTAGITKWIYPTVARRYKTTSAAVERSIRTAIKRSWAQSSTGARLELFGTYAVSPDWLPTNSEFIYILADRLSCMRVTRYCEERNICR